MTLFWQIFWNLFWYSSRWKQVLAHAGSCELEMQLVSEQVASPFWAALPPTNALRNMALELANTEVTTRLNPLIKNAFHIHFHPAFLDWHHGTSRYQFWCVQHMARLVGLVDVVLQKSTPDTDLMQSKK